MQKTRDFTGSEAINESGYTDVRICKYKDNTQKYEGEIIHDSTQVKEELKIYREISSGLNESGSKSLELEFVIKEFTDSKTIRSKKPKKIDKHQAFVNKTRIEIIDEEHIQIIAPKKEKKIYTRLTMGLGKTGWKKFTSVLEYGYISAGINPRNKKRIIIGQKEINKYDNTRKTLDRISKKLIMIYNKEYGIDIPDNFKMFSIDNSESDTGIYKPIFLTSSQYEGLQVLKSCEEQGLSIIKLKEHLRC